MRRLALQSTVPKGSLAWRQGDLPAPSSPAFALRVLGAVALVGVGVVHLQQYFGAGFDSIPTINTLFLLNGVGSAMVAAGLLGLGGWLFAVAGIGIAASSLGFLIVSFSTPVFHLMESLRGPVVLAIVFEVLAIALLCGYLLTSGWSDAS